MTSSPRLPPAILLFAALSMATSGGEAAEVAGAAAATATGSASEELAQIYEADQADRVRPAGEGIGLHEVGQRDRQRRARVQELYESDQLQTGADYYHAAMVLQHGREPNDYLLAHEFCMAALALGHERARWLSAATLDRFLKSIGRPQRFGTQYSSSVTDPRMRLYEVEEGVRDSLRHQLRVPALSEAMAREEVMTSRLVDRVPMVSLLTLSPDQAEARGLTVLDLAAGDQQPKFLMRSDPLYPPELQGIEGQVMVAFTVELDGSVSSPLVAIGNSDALSDVARAAVVQWKFRPALKNGQPVRVLVHSNLIFIAPTSTPEDHHPAR